LAHPLCITNQPKCPVIWLLFKFSGAPAEVRSTNVLAFQINFRRKFFPYNETIVFIGRRHDLDMSRCWKVTNFCCRIVVSLSVGAVVGYDMSVAGVRVVLQNKGQSNLAIHVRHRCELGLRPPNLPFPWEDCMGPLTNTMLVGTT